MRDLLLAAIVFGSIPFIFYRPHIGVLVWAWLTFMTPFNYAWSFAADFRWAFLVAAVTVLAWLISREPKRISAAPPSLLLIAFWAFTGLTTLFAMFPDQAQAKWIEFTKIVALDLVLTVALFADRRRLNALVWVIVASIGFFGVKGGISTLLTGGTIHVGAVDGSYFADNNLLAAALLMTIPLMRYLQLHTSEKAVRWGLALAMLLCVLAVLGTQSRGGLVGLVAMALLLFARSPKKLLFSVGLVFVLTAGIAFMPDSWSKRMETIYAYDQDASVQSRFNSWEFGYELAQERPLLGGGFEAFRANRDKASSVGYRAAHSIYFQVMGEHGFAGLFVYVCLMLSSLLYGLSALRRTAGNADLVWARDLLRMTQIGITIFLVTGAALSIAYFELLVFLVAISIAVSQAIQAQAAQREKNAGRPATTERLVAASSSALPRIAE